MRMALCWPSIILLIHAFSFANAGFQITTELTKFVPTCAQVCFISFLDSNFDTQACGTIPALDCLCSHNSTTGYTVGELAVQCITSEINIGFCEGNDAQQSVVVSAYNMCNGQANALPNTHATITATLIVQSSMPSIVLAAPQATTTASSSSNWSYTMGVPSTSSTSAFVTSSGSPSKSTPAASTYSAVASSMSPTPRPTPTLTRPQIIGITVASIGGGAVAVGIVILFACWRRRKQREARESDMLPFQMDPSTGDSTPGFFKGPTERGGGTANSTPTRIPPKVPPRLDISDPNMFSRRSIKVDTIGLAVSPENNMAQHIMQRNSRLLPEKPSLTLMTQSQARQQTGGLAFSQRAMQPSAVSRQSTATQFEEDDDGVDTAPADEGSWRAKPVDGIWDHSTGRWTTIRPVDSHPQYLPTSNPVGENQWVPQTSNPTMSPDSYVKPLTLASKVGSFSQPRRPDAFQRPAQQQLQQLSIPAGRPITTTSSVYSQPTQRGSVPGDAARHSNTRARRSYKQPYDHNSMGSLTSFETESIISPEEQEPETAVTTRTADLSPVMESPGSGRSPVSYPKIPGRLSADFRAIPPPPQPDFTKALGAQAGAGKPWQPWRQAEIAAQRDRERAQVGMQPLGPGPGFSGHQRQRSRNSASYTFPPPPQAAVTRLQADPVPQNQAPPSSQRHLLPPLQTQLQNNIPPPPSLPPPIPLTDATGGWGIPPSNTQLSSALLPNPLLSHPSITFTRSSSTVSAYSSTSTGKLSTSSSLLAKRRGEERAQALSLSSDEEQQKKLKNAGKWRVLGREEQEEAKKVGWKPMLGNRGETKAEYEQRTGQMLERTELPNTPGWVPKLTPTRRGDELFLSVQ